MSPSQTHSPHTPFTITPFTNLFSLHTNMFVPVDACSACHSHTDVANPESQNPFETNKATVSIAANMSATASSAKILELNAAVIFDDE